MKQSLSKTTRTFRHSLLSLGLLLGSCGTLPEGPSSPGTPPVPTTDCAAAGTICVNFQNQDVSPPANMKADYGNTFSAARGYGWTTDMSAQTRTRSGTSIDTASATFIHMQPSGTNGTWEHALPNGTYTVTVSVGDADPRYADSVHSITVEGRGAITEFDDITNVKFNVVTVTVPVTDGRLTITPLGGQSVNTKLNYVIIQPGTNPVVRATNPKRYENVPSTTLAISLELEPVPGGKGVETSSIAGNVRLTETLTGASVNVGATTSGGGDVVNVTPAVSLKANTQYTLSVSSGMKDSDGRSFRPFTTTFTTGNATTPSSYPFQQVALPVAGSEPDGQLGYTSVVIGPDRKLYAATVAGIIMRFDILADGTLANPHAIRTIMNKEGGPRTVIGMAFAPGSAAGNLKLYVSSNVMYQGDNAPTPADWTSKITVLTGANLENAQDVVTGLPRSSVDHMTNSITFRPGDNNNLYVLQGSNSSLGSPDSFWGNRNEHLLTAALLKVDLSKITSGPVNVQTEGGANYNPFATGAPVTIYARGIRNAYDMVWHTNGSLYVPTNGSASGGNAPATPNVLPSSCMNRPDYTAGFTLPKSPVISSASEQKDYLFRVVQNGYYGHPNPTRCEYTAFRGNPSGSTAPDTLKEYPSGTQPDPNYRGYAYNFGTHISPNGAVEYRTTNNASIRGHLVVTRFAGPRDLVALTVNGDGTIGSEKVLAAFPPVVTGSATYPSGPLDVIEDTTNGNLYVALLDQSSGRGRLVLLRPR